MSINFNLILIRPFLKSDSLEILRDELGCHAAIHSYPAKFQRSAFSLWIGQIEDCLVLDGIDAIELIPLADGAPGSTAVEPELVERVSHRFPDSEIAAAFFDGRVGCYGYSVFRSGKMIRCSSGYSGMPVKNYGEKLPFETNYISSTYRATENNGVTSYKSIEFPEEDILSDADIGADLTFELFRVFTGFEFSLTEMSKVKGTGFSDEPITFDPQNLLEYPKRPESRPVLQPLGGQRFSWRSSVLLFAAIFLIWLFLMATR